MAFHTTFPCFWRGKALPREDGGLAGNGEAHPQKRTPADSRGLRRLDDINNSCLEVFRQHWQCLDNNNHQLWQCRPEEWKLNKCVYENLVGRPNPLLDTGGC